MIHSGLWDLQVIHTDSGLSYCMYRQPTFTGLYNRWDSFCDTRQNINLGTSITTRAVKICTPNKIEEELSPCPRYLKRLSTSYHLEHYRKDWTQYQTGANFQSDWSGHDKTQASSRSSSLGKVERVHRSFWIAVEKLDHAWVIPESAIAHTLYNLESFSRVVKDVLTAAMKTNDIDHFTCDCRQFGVHLHVFWRENCGFAQIIFIFLHIFLSPTESHHIIHSFIIFCDFICEVTKIWSSMESSSSLGNPWRACWSRLLVNFN